MLVHFLTLIQLLSFAMLFVVKSIDGIAIAFPDMIFANIHIRSFLCGHVLLGWHSFSSAERVGIRESTQPSSPLFPSAEEHNATPIESLRYTTGASEWSSILPPKRKHQ
jgi:hypothetical protein